MRKEDLIKLKSENFGNPVVKNLINTIIGELDRKSKNPSESEVMSVIKKIRESNSLVTQTNQIIEENSFLDSIIPENLGEDKIKSILDSLNFNSIGEFMSYFKNNYPGRYDGKLLSKLVKDKLS